MSAAVIASAVRRLLRISVVSLIAVLVILAVYVSLGRQLVPLIGNHTPWVEERLSQLLNADVSITSIQGEWHGFSPHLELQGLRVQGRGARQGDPGLWLEHVSIAANVPASLRHWRPVLADTRIQALNLRFVQRPDGSWTLAGMGTELGGSAPSADQIFHWVQGLARLQLDEARLEFDHYTG